MTLPDFGRHALSALIGAVLTLAATLLVQYHSHSFSQSVIDAENIRKENDREMEILNQLAGAYDDLGDIPRKAAEFAEEGSIGTADDVRVVVRHFTRVMRAIRTNQVGADKVANYYGGRLRGWGIRLSALSEPGNRQHNKFSNIEKHNIRLLGPALTEIAEKFSVSFYDKDDLPAVSAYAEMDNSESAE